MDLKKGSKEEIIVQTELLKDKCKERLKTSRSTEGQECRECIGRIPYATLIATVMLEPFHLVFMIVGVAMGILGLILLLWGCLATGETRYSVYRADRARLIGGRVCGTVFMTLVYFLNIIWLLIFVCLIVLSTVFTFFLSIDMNRDKLKICTDGDKKLFCRDYVQSAHIMFVLATVSCLLVIISLVNYLMCLSANYAHIKESEKFRDLEEIQRLKDSEMTSLTKDRY
ncbi:unnamed protein product [Notodromas monacha]|uniref:Neuronal membrane glycoprotein M6-a n=1 Tax=Notodromas monacha TaxID=399045 RepID=A0A7R9BNV1_9CRUS|nr:unnamed protein product [Notodromas monacha]CAG0918959.1 unnamed protein product [Notodromas monacha]